MQELRLVAVSEDGTYLVLATAGRGTRFTLPVDDRLRAAVRGHFSRLGQFEIEVESPLRPKEIQARIRSGETAEEIAESAGIPVERVRWFEGPVLQEREYMAQQAQRVSVRRPGESTPGPPLGETVEERLGRGGVDLEESEWDSWKCEDGTWRVRLSFFEGGRPHAAEWTFDPRRRHVSPLDEIAARLTSVEWDDDALSDTVTPLVPRRPAMKVVGSDRDYPTETTPLRGGPHDEPRESTFGLRDATGVRHSGDRESARNEPTAADLRAATQPPTARPYNERENETGTPRRHGRPQAPSAQPRDEYASARNPSTTSELRAGTTRHHESAQSETATTGRHSRPQAPGTQSRDEYEGGETPETARSASPGELRDASQPTDTTRLRNEDAQSDPGTAGRGEAQAPAARPRTDDESARVAPSAAELREHEAARGATGAGQPHERESAPGAASAGEPHERETTRGPAGTGEQREEHQTTHGATSAGQLRERESARGAASAGELREEHESTRGATGAGELRDEREAARGAASASELRDEHEAARGATRAGELRKEHESARDASRAGELREREAVRGAVGAGELREEHETARGAVGAGEPHERESARGAASAGELRDEHEAARGVSRVGELRDAAQPTGTARLRDDEGAESEPGAARGEAQAPGARSHDEYERDETARGTGELRDASRTGGTTRRHDEHESARSESATAGRRSGSRDEDEHGESARDAGELGDVSQATGADEHERGETVSAVGEQDDAAELRDEREVTPVGVRRGGGGTAQSTEDEEPHGESGASLPDEEAGAASGDVHEEDAGAEERSRAAAAKPAAKKPPAPRQPARAPAKKKPATRPTMPAAQDKPATGSPAAAANSEGGAQRPARRRKAKGKRASVPSWDEIMFGARRPE
ncbi:septation protein SepH [Actinomadura sp. BRA 177]|uniref:septation protein SepH n=1 Tax=Actinomadura sp. BRA 177 TaxID=2745202 RepID=UPI0020CDABBF|nr:septation protein SepH [Actinomadura sp. BRA 177]